jgi:hypothetical protein
MAKENKSSRPVGRPKNIETPEIMWQLFQQYKVDIKSNPFIIKDLVGGMGKQVLREKEKPLTLEGFNVWCFEQGVASWLHDYFMNKEGRYQEFANICSIIKEQIRQDQIGGGMAGIYNASITQRLNGLTEKIQQETNNKTEIQGKIQIEVTSSPVPLANRETDVNTSK